MKTIRQRSGVLDIKAALLLTAFWAGGNCANAGVTTTVDPGAVGSTVHFTTTVTLTDPTIDFVEIFFEDAKFLEVMENDLHFFLFMFGSPPEGGNSRSAVSWGLLGESGAPIFTVSRPNDLIATAFFGARNDLPEPFRVFGFFVTFDPPVFVQAGISQVRFEFGFDILVGGEAAATPVNIDIKPGNKHNNFNPLSSGRIWVAILSDITPESPFDPLSQVDIPTVQFGPDAAKAIRHKARDVNRDGLDDLLLQFQIRETGIACGETEATLTGETFGGQQFSGTDLMNTVGCD